MRLNWLVILLCLLSACGGSSGSVAAEVTWRMDYGDPTDDGLTDLRDCSNAPDSGYGPAYREVDSVRLQLTDPAGQVPGVDLTFACDQGDRGQSVPIRGVSPQAFELLLEAAAADGTLLYTYADPAYDLSGEKREDLLTLATVTGELRFFPKFGDSFDCPSQLSFRYNLYRHEDGLPATTATVSGLFEDACEPIGGGYQVPELFIRELPVVLETSRQTTNNYRLVLEAVDAGGDVTHCGVNPSRPVRLGDNLNSVGGNEVLTSGPCPP